MSRIPFRWFTVQGLLRVLLVLVAALLVIELGLRLWDLLEIATAGESTSPDAPKP